MVWCVGMALGGKIQEARALCESISDAENEAIACWRTFRKVTNHKSRDQKPLCVLRHPGRRTLLDRSGDGRDEAAEESEYAMTKMKILSHRALRGLSDGRGGGAWSASDVTACWAYA